MRKLEPRKKYSTLIASGFVAGGSVHLAPASSRSVQIATSVSLREAHDLGGGAGGVLPAHVDYGLARINSEASSFLLGKRAELPKVLAAEDSPVWTRDYGSDEVAPEVCGMLGRVLQGVGAKRLIVGHTVQKDGISAACGDRLFRIDVGLSAYYGNNPVQVLEITAKGARVLTSGAAGSGKKSAPHDSALHSSP